MPAPKTCSQCGAAIASSNGVCDRCSEVSDAPTIPPSDNARALVAGATNLATLPPANPTATAPAAPMSSAPVGAMFGDFELIEELARGGMGVVYRARQKSLNRIVALKMILAGQLASKTEVQRFLTEAEAAAKLEHSGIVPIYDIGEIDGQHYFSMPLIDGPSLAERLQRGPLPSDEAARYLAQVAHAVHYAHQQGIVHRDLKPANILLDQKSSAKVMDFGLAKNIAEDSGMTATGQVMGTAGYMPPEQAKGDVVDRRSDVYSIGAILYCLLTGRPPFQAATQMETLIQVLEREPIPPKQLNPAISTDLQTIALKCLQKLPARRYDTAEEVADELQRVLEGRPIVARPVSATERFWRWCQRNKAVAGLLAGLAASIVVGIIAVSVQWRRAESAYGLASIKVVELTQAEGQLAEQLYSSNLLRGDALKLAGQKVQAESLFRELADNPIDPNDRRAWWRLWQHYWQEPRDGFIPVAGGLPVISDAAGVIAVVDGPRIHLVDIDSFEKQSTLQSDHSDISQARISPDGTWLVASHSGDGQLSVWNLKQPGKPQTLQSSRGLTLQEFEKQALQTVGGGGDFMKLMGKTMMAASQLQFFANEKFVQVDFNGVHLWDLSDNSETIIEGTRRGLQGQQDRLIRVSADGSRVWMRRVSFTPGPVIVEYAIEDESVETRWLGRSDSQLKSFATKQPADQYAMFTRCAVTASDDGKLFAVVEDLGPCRLTIWDTETDTLQVTRDEDLIYPKVSPELQFSHDGRRLAMTAGTSMTLFSCQDLTTVSTIEVPTYSQFGGVVVDSNQHERWLISQRSSRARQTKQMQLAISPVAVEPPVRINKPKVIGQVQLGPAGSAYAVGLAPPVPGNAIFRVDKDKIVARHAVSVRRSYEAPLAVSADGTMLVAVDEQKKLFVMDGKSLEPRQSLQLKIPSGRVLVAAAPDGSRIAYVARDGSLHICDTNDLETKVTQKLDQLLVGKIGFSNTGKWITRVGARPVEGSVEAEYSLEIYDAESGKQVAGSVVERQSRAGVASPALLFSEDDTTLYIGTDDIRVVSVPDLQLIASWKSEGEIQSMAQHADDHVLFCGTTSGAILVMDTQFGHQNIALQVSDSPVSELKFDKAQNVLRFIKGSHEAVIDLSPAASRIEMNRRTRIQLKDTNHKLGSTSGTE